MSAVRVPFADANCLVLPPDQEDKKNDCVMLFDIFPTGYHAPELAGVKAGDGVFIFGGGPVGLMAAYSARLKGASKIMVVDTLKDRLGLAQHIGAIAIDYSDGSAVDKILDLTDGQGKAGAG